MYKKSTGMFVTAAMVVNTLTGANISAAENSTQNFAANTQEARVGGQSNQGNGKGNSCADASGLDHGDAACFNEQTAFYFGETLINDSLAESLGGDELGTWNYCEDADGDKLDDCIILTSLEGNAIITRTLGAVSCGSSSGACYSGKLILAQSNMLPASEHLSVDGFVLSMNTEMYITTGSIGSYSLDLAGTADIELIVNKSYSQYEMTLYDASGAPIKGGHSLGWTPIATSSTSNCEQWGNSVETAVNSLANLPPVFGSVVGASWGFGVSGGPAAAATLASGGYLTPAAVTAVAATTYLGGSVGFWLGENIMYGMNFAAPFMGTTTTALCEFIEYLPDNYQLFLDFAWDDTGSGTCLFDYDVICVTTSTWDASRGELTVTETCYAQVYCL